MKIIIVGAGVVGTQLAHQLIEQKHDVTLVERDEDLVYRLRGRLDCLIVNEEGNNHDTLKKIGAGGADFFVCVTHSDELNLLMCGMVSSTEGAGPKKIARVRNIRYSTSNTYRRSFNVDYLINPEAEVMQAITNSVDAGALSNVLKFEHSSIQLRSISVDEGSTFCNKPLRVINKENETRFLVGLIVRGNDYLIPTGDTLVLPHDLLYVAAEEGEFETIYKLLGSEKKRLRNIVIVGGQKIGELLADHIVNRNRGQRKRLEGQLFPKINLAIIEDDRETAKQLATQFPKALVINGDISDNQILEEDNLSKADLIVCTTANDDRNLLSATYGKILGIKRAIVMVSRTSYPQLGHKLGIDATISLKSTVVNAILRSIYRKQVTGLHTILDGKIEVVEFLVSVTSKANGMKIVDISLPEDSLMLSITRDKKTFIPRGDFVIRVGDRIAVIIRSEHSEAIARLLTDYTAAGE